MDFYFHTRLLILQPTPYCNLDCKYCYLPDKNNKIKMPLDIVEKTFDKFFSSGLVKDQVAVIWHCGEPLTVGISYFKDTLEILRSTSKKYNLEKKINKGIQTNGVLLNDEWCQLFKAEDFNVGLSIDGPEFIHDQQRTTRTGVGTHQAVMRGLEYLKNNEVNFNIICVLRESSLDYARELHDFFASTGVKFVGFNMDEIEGTNKQSSFNQNSTEQTLEKFKNFLNELYDLVEESQAFCVREFEFAKGCILGTNSLKHHESRPLSIITVDYNGDFSTFSPELSDMKSLEYGDFKFGNMINFSLNDLVTSEKFIRVNQAINKGIRLCEQDCEYFPVCGGGSSSNKYFEHGTFECTETLFCKLMKKAVTDVVLEKMEDFNSPSGEALSRGQEPGGKIFS